MTGTEKKVTSASEKPPEREAANANDKPVCTVKGLFRDTRFIIEEAKRMAQGVK